MSNRLDVLQARERLASLDGGRNDRHFVLFAASVNGHAQAVVFSQGQLTGTQWQPQQSLTPSIESNANKVGRGAPGMMEIFNATVARMRNGGAPQQLLADNDLLGAITGRGSSLEDLQGLHPDQLIGLLHSQGVDVSALMPEQVQSLIEAVSADGVSDIRNRR